MANVRTFTRAFSGGEVSPEMFGRFDLAHVAQAVATMRNFIPLPHGPAANRTGTEFVKEVGNSSKKTRLIPFSYNNTQTFAIELGAGFFRWHTLGATLLAGSPAAYNGATAYVIGDLVSSSGVNYYCIQAGTGHTPVSSPTYWYAMPADGTYEIPNSYAEADLFDIHYTQSADVLTLVHPSYAPLELRRYGATNWQTKTPTFAPTITAPTSPTATPVLAGGVSYSYVCTSVSSTDNLEESAASAVATCTNDLSIAGHSNTLACTAPGGATRVNWYKLSGGLYGYIGQAAPGSTFSDTNITPDISRTPPQADATFASGAGYYPAAVGYFEQRRVFAGWSNGPQNLLATRSGTESNTNYHIPTVADDRIAFRVAAREASAIRHIVPLQEMILLTATNEFRVASGDGGALTGANVSVKPQSYLGANNVQPVVVGRAILYAQASGGRVREMTYAGPYYGYYTTNDISLMAPHLFDYFNVVDMAFARAPYPILWCVNDQGALLGMTYIPDQQISAWHRHDTDGTFESCCVISEEGEDKLYVIIKRTIGGATKRYVERMHTREMATQSDAFFVDCGATYSGAPVSTVSGLTWLEGKTVSILGDGAVMPPQVVTGGAVALQSPCSKVQVGLPITADLQTLPLAIATPDFGQGRPKNVNKVFLRAVHSSGIYAGPDSSHLTPYKQRSTEPYGSPPNWIEDEVEIVLDNAWSTGGQVFIRQSDPLPLTLVSATIEVAIGG